MSNIIDMKDVDAATCALMDWFKSQDVPPADAMIVVANLSARLIIENSKCKADLENKITLGVDAIRAFIAIEQMRSVTQ